MVESGKEYVLQWPGHAAYVTERFSGLLARQTLVDITLICDEQKLRVHKLVLASCSLYFEEMLMEDLGPEPIIFLRDLNFNILKAMIEFMYCGETTVSHIHLPSLLTAARLFKVKELESLVEKMVGLQTQDHNDNNEKYLSKDVSSTGMMNGLVNSEDNGIRVFSNKLTNNGQSNFDGTESSDSESERNYLDENRLDSPNDACLYDESCNRLNKHKRNGENYHGYREKSIDSVSDTTSTLDSENCEKDYERCCDFVQNGCGQNDELDNEVNRVGQCSKVYTHKKRKVDRHTRVFEKILPQPLTPSNRIDLTDESSNDDTPITLKTNLDESSDYLLSFNSESIQSIVGCSIADFCPSNTFELLNARTHVDKNNEDDDDDDEEEDSRPRVLRRSVRLNQQENDETTTYSRKRLKSKLRDDKKGQKEPKRKNKDLERRVPNVKVLVSTPTPKKSRKRCNNNQGAKTNRDSKPKNNNQSMKSTASVNRALWGDMSDVTEDGYTEINEEFLEYSSSAEIPFAVGLLPLRAALERMQATLDHQPRKTRSSVTKLDGNSLKRKNSPCQQEVPTKKQQTNGDCITDDENASAVCHIQIRRTEQCTRPRKRSLSDSAANFEQTAVSGRQ